MAPDFPTDRQCVRHLSVKIGMTAQQHLPATHFALHAVTYQRHYVFPQATRRRQSHAGLRRLTHFTRQRMFTPPL